MPRTPESTDSEDFAAILARFEAEHGGAPARGAGPKVGDRVRGRIVGFGEETAFVDLGGKAEGQVALDELRDPEGRLTVEVGQALDAIVAASDRETGALILRVRPGREGTGNEAAVAELREAFAHRIAVEGRISGVNKGGVDVEIAGLRAFCPVSQLDLRYVADPNEYVGRRLTFRVTRIEEGRGRRPDVVVSRRDVLAEEAAARAAEARAKLQVGQTVRGRVTSIAHYGAFVDLGGVEGLLHVSEISHRRVADPAEVLAVGQEVEVAILRFEAGKGEGAPERISLSLRSLEPDPWRNAAERFPEGAVFAGKVVRLEAFGAFVEVAPGVDGLVHVSELAPGRRIHHPREAVQPGQELRVKILGVDPVKRRLSLAPAAEDDFADETGAAPRPAAAADAGGFGALGDFFKQDRPGKRR